jgi:hypothetical protein
MEWFLREWVNVPTSSAIDSIQPLTTYHYRIAIRNGAGTFYGNDRTFKTPLDSIFESYWNVGPTPNSWASVQGNTWVGQSFKNTGVRHKLMSVDIIGFKYGFPGDVLVEVYRTNCTLKPLGSPIATGVFNGEELNLQGAEPFWTEKNVPLSPNPWVWHNQRLVFIVKVLGTGGIGLGFNADNPEEGADIIPYPFGAWTRTRDGGLTWEIDREASTWFREWGRVTC